MGQNEYINTIRMEIAFSKYENMNAVESPS